MQYVMHKTASGESFLAVTTADGELLSASESHPRWDEIVKRTLAGDESVAEIFNIAQAVTKAFQRVTERVVFRDGQVLFDGDPIDTGLEGKILDFYKNNEDFAPFVAFLERLMNNPDQHSREQLYSWLTRHNLTITKDGYMVAYKGVREDFTSSHPGPGIVNGVEQNGHLDNTPGNVLEMARSQVTNDPTITCAQGLHVANWNYAESWSSTTLAVLVDPRDIVSVPNDANFQKVRVARYTVIEKVKAPYEGMTIDKTREELVSPQDAPVETPQDAPVDDEPFQVGDRVVKDGFDHYTSDSFRNFGETEALVGAAGTVREIYNDGDLSVAWDTPVRNFIPTSRIKPMYVVREDNRPVSVKGLKPQDSGRPTDNNHLKQKRGPDGKFLRKVKGS